MVDRFVAAAPLCQARVAGGFFLLSVTAALSGEFLVQGKAAIALGLVAVACYVGVTLLVYMIYKHVDRNIAVLALIFNIAGLALEAARWNPRGVDVAMVFHGVYCLAIGYLIFNSELVPRFLGVSIAFAGLLWQINLSPSLARSLSTYSTAIGLVGEGLPYLWLLVMGARVRR